MPKPKPQKPARAKAVRAWAWVSRDGYFYRHLYLTRVEGLRAATRLFEDGGVVGDRLARVELREVPPKRRRKGAKRAR